MPRSDLRVAIDGEWLDALGDVSSVGYSSRHGDGPCGPDLATVEVRLDERNDLAALRMGQPAVIYTRFGQRRLTGVISGVGRGIPRVIEIKGQSRVEWDAILSPEPGARIGRDEWGEPYTPTDPTTPRWFLDASDLDIGVADDRLFTQVIATYVSAQGAEGEDDITSQAIANADGTNGTEDAQDQFGILPYALDLTPLGLITYDVAEDYAMQQLREFSIPEWTSRITTDSTRLRDLGDHPAYLPDVQAGQMVRMFGLPATHGGLRTQAATDVILGEVSYSSDSPDEITLSPARVAVRSIADAVRAMAEARKAAEDAAKKAA